MEQFRKGNVVRLEGGTLVVICGYRHISSRQWGNDPNLNYEVCDYIFVNSCASSGSSRVDKITKEESCNCDLVNDYIKKDCEDCMGSGECIVTYYGMENATLVAPTIKQWISNAMLRGFNL